MKLSQILFATCCLIVFYYFYTTRAMLPPQSITAANACAATIPANIPFSDSLLYLRFAPPHGFSRFAVDKQSFGNYLRQLPLKPAGSLVLYYNGAFKKNKNVYAAVVDMPIGKRDLHQCADAIMHLRADFLWGNEQYDKIQFNLTNGFTANYARWKNGERIQVSNTQTQWVRSASPSGSYEVFWQYLEFVFAYAGTLSLSKELKPVSADSLQIGDIFIKGGSPGHAVIVVDAAVDSLGQKIFMLAQSYMPAQEIQILVNPTDLKLSPWYRVDQEKSLITPEWDFEWSQLKRF